MGVYKHYVFVSIHMYVCVNDYVYNKHTYMYVYVYDYVY